MKQQVGSQGVTPQGCNFSAENHEDFETLNSLQIEHKMLKTVAKKIFETMEVKFEAILNIADLPDDTDICVSDYSLKELPILLNQFLEFYKSDLDPNELFSASGPGGDVTIFEKKVSDLTSRVETLQEALASAESVKEEKDRKILDQQIQANNSADAAYKMKILDLSRQELHNSKKDDAPTAESILDITYEHIEDNVGILEEMRKKLKDEIKNSTGSLSKYTYFFIKETARIKEEMDSFYNEEFEPFALEVTNLFSNGELRESSLDDKFNTATGKEIKLLLYSPTFRKIASDILGKAKEYKLKASAKSQLRNLTTNPKEYQYAGVFCKAFMTIEPFHEAVHEKYMEALVEQKLVPADWNRLNFHYVNLRHRESALKTATLTPTEEYEARNLVWDSGDDDENIDEMQSLALERAMSVFSNKARNRNPDDSGDTMEIEEVRSVNKTPSRGYIYEFEV